ncbi:MAG: NAD kinase [Prevotella sp.]|nr:NAD kinase [Prevotella sp.]MCR5152300.1 NAD kinase [Prevotella sp.]
MRFVLFGNEYQTKKSASVQKILSYINERGDEVIVDRVYYDFLTQKQKIMVPTAEIIDDDNFTADIAISMGGDGTFLKAASRVAGKDIPVIGVNTGRLGFLADISPEGIENAMQNIYDGNYIVERHTMIEISTQGKQITGSRYALNDIAVLKHDNASMISIDTHINGEHLVTYQADGLVVSTPTGSTAYNLSNGGPIIAPQSASLCLTPVAPHSLNVRPLVVSENMEITLEVESRSHNYLVAIDGRSESLPEDTKVTIRKAPFDTQIIKRHHNSYFATLREKMMWGADRR